MYVLLGTKKKSICVRNDWLVLRKIWSATIKADHSEKPSIIALIDTIHNTIVENLESFQIVLEVKFFAFFLS